MANWTDAIVPNEWRRTPWEPFPWKQCSLVGCSIHGLRMTHGTYVQTFSRTDSMQFYGHIGKHKAHSIFVEAPSRMMFWISLKIMFMCVVSSLANSSNCLICVSVRYRERARNDVFGRIELWRYWNSGMTHNWNMFYYTNKWFKKTVTMAFELMWSESYEEGIERWIEAKQKWGWIEGKRTRQWFQVSRNILDFVWGHWNPICSAIIQRKM